MDWRIIGRKLLFIPIWVIAVLTVLSVVGLVLVFVNGWETTLSVLFIAVLDVPVSWKAAEKRMRKKENIVFK